jgi:tetratricopeptide (TPR) repeat protein
MLETLDDIGVPALLLTVPSNLRDWQPHVSIPSDPIQHAGRGSLVAGRAALRKGEHAAAIELLTKAVTASPEHAASHFHMGHALEAVGRHAESYDSFVSARDLDANPFRAVSRFNNILRRVSAGFAKVRLVDIEKAFRDASTPRAPGFDLMLDYVHPTKTGNVLIAKTLFQAIADAGYLGAPAKPFEHMPAKGDNGNIYDEDSDDDLQTVLLYIAMMMHQQEMVVRLADKLMERPGVIEAMDPEDVYHVKEAREVFGELIELDEKELEAGALSPERTALEPRLNQLYKNVFGNYVEYQGKRWQ